MFMVTALPVWPEVVQVVPAARVPVLVLPELSAVVVPVFSSKSYWVLGLSP